jgi:hypothetical protein
MIYFVDNFVDKDLFIIAQNYLNDGAFVKHVLEEKIFM